LVGLVGASANPADYTTVSRRGEGISPICIDGHLMPSAFILGVQKAATTTLAYQLQRSPDIIFGSCQGSIHYCGRKEKHFFGHWNPTDVTKYPNQTKIMNMYIETCSPCVSSMTAAFFWMQRQTISPAPWRGMELEHIMGIWQADCDSFSQSEIPHSACSPHSDMRESIVTLRQIQSGGYGVYARCYSKIM
jgi:hypothetical protein